jgi:hypothetical protein
MIPLRCVPGRNSEPICRFGREVQVRPGPIPGRPPSFVAVTATDQKHRLCNHNCNRNGNNRFADLEARVADPQQ